ncbi:aldo/keto reductase family protein [Asticcacaulis biprosthecium C19]|uniref:Aldo/keto reductase family protein n=1 Tax=Asticcacaulis biprosthecium C19 TaxID=715226 RepID=F4QSG2_9CAUL|nr:aldo/keto reductase family protein [Asticcacaulis biprosthecium C19]
MLALGAASLGSVYSHVSQAHADATVQTALDLGVSLIDVAPYYGLTRAETALGHALQGVERSRYTLATKVGRYGDKAWDFSRDATLRSLDESLRRLKTGHVDILQCHDIEHGDLKQLVEEALPALRDLKAQGVIRYVGITGYDLAVLEKIAVEQQIDTVMAYCTFTLQDQRLGPVARRLKTHDIAVFNASPLGMGLLTRKGPPDWHPGHETVHRAAAEAARICTEAGSDISRLAVQWALRQAAEHGIASTVIGSSSAANMRDNVAAMSASVDAALLAHVETVLAPVRDKGWDVLPGNGGKAGQ